MTTYTISATGYTTRTISAINEAYARNIFMLQAGWLSDMAGFSDFYDRLTVTEH